jgi:hypothetical protein
VPAAGFSSLIGTDAGEGTAGAAPLVGSTGAATFRRAGSKLHTSRKLMAAAAMMMAKLCSSRGRPDASGGRVVVDSVCDGAGAKAGSVKGTKSPAVSRRPQKPARAGKLLLPDERPRGDDTGRARADRGSGGLLGRAALGGGSGRFSGRTGARAGAEGAGAIGARAAGGATAAGAAGWAGGLSGDPLALACPRTVGAF